MRVLVTGAAGFVGRHLSAYLEAQGDVVVGVDRSDGPDLGDGAGWASLVERVAPDAVYHLGGWSDVGASWDDPAAAFRVNAEGTLHVLQACVGSGSRPKVLVVSSADVYGQVAPERLPIGEGAELCPITPYAASKVAADYLGVQAHRGYGLEVVRARAFNHLGPGQTARFVAPAIAARIVANEATGADVVPVGNVTPRRDFTDVRDVVRAYRALIVDGVPGEAYNVCSGVDLAIGELAERLVGLAVAPMRLVPDPDLQRPVETPVLRGDNTKLRAATGWAPEIDLDTTLADILDEHRRARRPASSTP
ncbi:GDP-mannose 4,6-dehydratase [Rhabdothermincola salaria]|uniref:GDP-mannose 4,6-dehydratase n=1 Tax=Rhabdothermincola salaria TaxID=2903142 RepID=UPI001E431DA9|nr:GDP-mannose 4,6-dehydratase [Rhabdothermincola salaria]MCD9623338.1 GDP-mannose 4,6-dehydratase [Rhabdothermincola salaria]